MIHHAAIFAAERLQRYFWLADLTRRQVAVAVSWAAGGPSLRNSCSCCGFVRLNTVRLRRHVRASVFINVSVSVMITFVVIIRSKAAAITIACVGGMTQRSSSNTRLRCSCCSYALCGGCVCRSSRGLLCGSSFRLLFSLGRSE